MKKIILAACDPHMLNTENERFIGRAEAVRRYMNRVKPLPFDEDVPGFYFTLDILEDFLNEVKRYNALSTTQTGCKITGIRIWQARSLAFDGIHLTEDLIITPALSDKSDIHAFTEGDSVKSPDGLTPLFLSSARPCPNLCGVGGPKYFYEYEGVRHC